MVTLKTAGPKTSASLTHRALGLSDEQALEMYWFMLLSRRLDERLWIIHRQHEIAFHISGIGHEACQVGLAYALRKGHDYLFPYYRDLATSLALGQQPRDVMLASYGKAGDPMSGAHQMPNHYNLRSANIVSVSSPVASQIPQASGTGFAIKYKGTDQVVAVCFGEGGTAEGDFHEALNWASIHKLPVIFYCQNNQYAISETTDREMAVNNVADRAVAYNMPGMIIRDGNDVFESYKVAKEAVERARRGEGPTLVEAKTYRPVPHSSDDDDRTYRSRDEVEVWKKRDPILMAKTYLMEAGVLGDKTNEEYEARARAMVDDANQFAKSADYPPAQDAFVNVWGTLPKA
jgi:2-oxoisovalerate dehydrogenase E1 component alpha subunit